MCSIPHCLTLLPLVGTRCQRSKVTSVGNDCDPVGVDPSLPWMERLCILLRQLQCPLLLVKVIIPPRSPAVQLFPSLPVLPSYKSVLDLHFCHGKWSIWLVPRYNPPPCLPSAAAACPLSHTPSRAQPLHSCCPLPDRMLHLPRKGCTFFYFTFYLFAASRWCLFVSCCKDYTQQNQ